MTCSGAGKDGSLRVLRNGIGIHEVARVELPGIKGLWSARLNGVAYLVLSFLSETRVLCMHSDEELGEVELPGFDAESATVLCSPLGDAAIVQVTASAFLRPSPPPPPPLPFAHALAHALALARCSRRPSRPTAKRSRRRTR